MALLVIIVPQELRGLGNIVRCDQKYSWVVGILFRDKGLKVEPSVDEPLGLPSYGSILQVNEIVFLAAEYLIRTFHHLVSKIDSTAFPATFAVYKKTSNLYVLIKSILFFFARRCGSLYCVLRKEIDGLFNRLYVLWTKEWCHLL